MGKKSRRSTDKANRVKRVNGAAKAKRIEKSGRAKRVLIG